MLRSALLLVLRTLVTLALTVVFAGLHLPRPVGRDAAERVLAAVLPTIVPGRLSVAHVDVVSASRLTVSGVRYADSRGHSLVEDGEAECDAPLALLRALVRGTDLPAMHAHVRRVRVFVPTIDPLATSVGPAASTRAATTGSAVRLPDLTLTVDEVVHELGNFPAVVTNVTARASLIAGPADQWNLRVTSLDATARAFTLGPERVHATAVLDHPQGLPVQPRVDVSLALRGNDLACDATVGFSPDGVLDLRAPDCTLSSGAINRLSTQPIALAARLRDLRLGGRPDALTLAASLFVAEQSARIEASLSAAAQSLTLTLDHLDLARVRCDLPVTDLHGPLRATHHADGDSHRFTLDSGALVASVARVPIPPAEALVTLHGTTLAIDRLRADSIGLDAHGTIDLATRTPHIDARAHLSTRTLETLPWVHGLASGALDADLDAHGTPDGLDGTLHAHAQNLRVADVSVPSAEVHGEVGVRGRTPSLALRFEARGVQRGATFGPARLSGSVRGDPTARMEVNLDAAGAGLLAILGPQPDARASPEGDTAVHLRAVVDRTGGDTRVHVADSALTLRGERARTRGEITLDRAGQPHGTLRLDLGAHGSAAVAFAQGRAAITLQSLDLGWLDHLLALPTPLSGTASGALQIASAAHGGTHGTLDVRDFVLDPIGSLHATLSLMPEGPRSTATVRIESEHGPALTGTFSLRVPDALGDADAWFRGVRDGQITLDEIGPSAVRSFMPPLVVPTGSLGAHATLTHSAPEAPIDVAIDVMGASLGAFVGSRHLSVVRPLRVRAHAALQILGVHSESLPLALRFEVGDEQRQTRRGHATDSELIPDASLVGASITLNGPWISAIPRAVSELQSGHAVRAEALTEATRTLLAEAHADAAVRVGPLLRSDWPLRGIAEVILPPPPVPPGSSATVTVTTQGPLLSLTTHVSTQATLPSLELADLPEPASIELNLTLAPRPDETLLGALTARAEGRLLLSPDAPAATRTAVLDAILEGRGDDVLARGLPAVGVRRFDVNLDDLPIERFASVRARDVTGLATVTLHASGDPARPVRMELSVRDLRAALRADSATRGRTPPLRAKVNAVVVRDRDRWDVHTCLAATEASADETCAPEAAMEALPESSTARLHAGAVLPWVGGFGRWRFEAARARATMSARGFRLEPLAPFLPLGAVTYLGGIVSTTAQWDGGGVEAVRGRFELRGGRLEVPSLGEPVRNVQIDATLADRRIVVGTGEADLGRGHVRATGEVRLLDDRANATLAVEATQMPAVQEGNTFGWIDGRAQVGLEVRADGLRGDISVERAQVLIHDQSVRTLQPLSPSPDLFVLGRTGGGSALEALGDFPMDFAVTMLTPVWVRRDDFAVAVRGAVSAHIDRGGTSLTGSIEQASAQSWIVEQGQRFEIDRMALQFTGGARIDPLLEIVAHHDTPGVGRITATLGGRLSAITLTLAAENQPDASMAEIASMLLFGRRDSPTASASTPDLAQRGVQLLAGQFVSFLSTAIGREMAFRVRPILESSETGGRVGGGVSVSPRVYLEASVSSSSSALAQGSTTTANAVELRSLGEYVLTSTVTLSSSLATGSTQQYRWSVDLFWSP